MTAAGPAPFRMPLHAIPAPRERDRDDHDDRVSVAIICPYDLMAPVYRKGDVLLCHPEAVAVVDRDFIFSRAADPAQLAAFPFAACVGRVVAISKSRLRIREYNPPRVRTLSRKRWRAAYKIVGKYNRDPITRLPRLPRLP